MLKIALKPSRMERSTHATPKYFMVVFIMPVYLHLKAISRKVGQYVCRLLSIFEMGCGNSCQNQFLCFMIEFEDDFRASDSFYPYFSVQLRGDCPDKLQTKAS